jgi:hypothetical protein
VNGIARLSEVIGAAHPTRLELVEEESEIVNAVAAG